MKLKNQKNPLKLREQFREKSRGCWMLPSLMDVNQP